MRIIIDVELQEDDAPTYTDRLIGILQEFIKRDVKPGKFSYDLIGRSFGSTQVTWNCISTLESTVIEQ